MKRSPHSLITAQPTADEIYKRMDRQHAVKGLPTLDEQLADTTRTTAFTYLAMRECLRIDDADHPHFADKSRRVTMTEHEGLTGLATFLEGQASGPNAYYASHARAIREHISFMGQPEFTEETRGVAMYWQTFLAGNRHRQLYLPMPLRGVYTANGASQLIRPKSDTYVLNGIMSHFTDDDLDRFAPQIKTDAADITAKPKHVKSVLLDDYALSGHQFKMQFISTAAALAQRPEYIPTIEGNALLVTREQAQCGLSGAHEILAELALTQLTDESVRYRNYVHAFVPEADFANHDQTTLTALLAQTAFGLTLQMKGYHVAHEWHRYGDEPERPISSSLHSSPDFQFEDEINSMVEADPDAEMPPLTNIVRTYRDGAMTHVGRLHAALESV